MTAFPEKLALWIDQVPVAVARGTSVAAALAQRPPGVARVSVRGEERAPLCGMGICHECRVTIDGRRMLACQTVCEDGMDIRTGLAETTEAGP